MKEQEEGWFHLGPNVSKQKKQLDSSAGQMILLKPMNTVDWKKYVKLSVEKTKGTIWNESALWGQKVHAVLAEIYTHLDVNLVFRKLILGGGMDEEEQDILVEAVQQVMNHPLLKPYYQVGVQVYNEHDILSEDGEIFRPDRMVIHHDTVVIIDYKTGEPSKKDHQQVKRYMRLAADYSNLKVKGFLVYLHQELLVEEV
ncbi:MAG: hypothetical protein GQ527_11125 [Bacteroidales bacterium]|nr:hypothetical protein [Bacteroidales bacterium]